MLLFLLLSIYLLQRGRVRPSALAFAIAILLKQDAVFALPAYCYWVMKGRPIRSSLGALAVVPVTILVVSLPFLVTVAYPYIAEVSYGLAGSYTPLVRTPAFIAAGYGLINGPPPPAANVWIVTACSSFGNYLLGGSQVCVETGPYGQAITVTLGIGPFPNETLLLAIPPFGLLAAAFIELRSVPEKFRFSLLFGLCMAVFVLSLFLASKLPTDKYYLVPPYAVLLASSTDRVSLAIATVIPIFTLLDPIPYLTIVIAALGVQLLVLNQVLKSRRLEASKRGEST